MISFSFRLANPFSNRWDTIFYRDRLFSKHKAGEIQVCKEAIIISFSFRFTTRCDHAGVSLDIGALGYTVMLQYNDTRHWNEDEGRYYIYDNAGNAS